MVKYIRRIVIGAGVVLVSLVLFLVLSILVDYAIGTGRIDSFTNTTIPGITDQPDVLAYVARPEGTGPFPVVIMIHEFYGLNNSIVGKAEGLAMEGYIVVAPDTFRGSTTAWIPRAIFQSITSDAQQVNQDLDSVIAWLEGQPEVDPQRIAIAGFCYGGRVSLNFSLHNPKIAATVVFYGSPVTDPAVLRSMPGPVLGIFGGADNSIPIDRVNAFEAGLNAAGIENEITIYPNQPHAFVTDMESIRKGGAQRQAWDQMIAFLERNLKSGSGSLKVKTSASKPTHLDWGYYLRLAWEHVFNTPEHAH